MRAEDGPSRAYAWARLPGEDEWRVVLKLGGSYWLDGRVVDVAETGPELETSPSLKIERPVVERT